MASLVERAQPPSLGVLAIAIVAMADALEFPALAI
jgi:hypothetical protein